mmetsp:Transcript_18550/g.50919  ORF Transcript_18550/g.50919 Transcript_18550/m.50919 type:complete len:216 (+) Transcript_18550:280-927(+)
MPDSSAASRPKKPRTLFLRQGSTKEITAHPPAAAFRTETRSPLDLLGAARSTAMADRLASSSKQRRSSASETGVRSSAFRPQLTNSSVGTSSFVFWSICGCNLTVTPDRTAISSVSRKSALRTVASLKVTVAQPPADFRTVTCLPIATAGSTSFFGPAAPFTASASRPFSFVLFFPSLSPAILPRSGSSCSSLPSPFPFFFFVCTTITSTLPSFL